MQNIPREASDLVALSPFTLAVGPRVVATTALLRLAVVAPLYKYRGVHVKYVWSDSLELRVCACNVLFSAEHQSIYQQTQKPKESTNSETDPIAWLMN